MVRHLQSCSAPRAAALRRNEEGPVTPIIDLSADAGIPEGVINMDMDMNMDGNMLVHTPPELLQDVEEISDMDVELSDSEHDVIPISMRRYVQLHPWAVPTEIVYSFELHA